MGKRAPSCRGRVCGCQLEMDTPTALPVELDGRTFCGDLDIHVDPHGDWYYNGGLIARHDMVCFFASMLVLDSTGHHWLVTPTEVGRIQVDDAPLVAQALYASLTNARQTLSFYTNVDQVITVGPQTPLVMKISPTTGQPTPYVINAHGIAAKISRAAYYDLVDLGDVLEVHGEETFGVWSDGAFFPLGSIADCDA